MNGYWWLEGDGGNWRMEGKQELGLRLGVVEGEGTEACKRGRNEALTSERSAHEIHDAGELGYMKVDAHKIQCINYASTTMIYACLGYKTASKTQTPPNAMHTHHPTQNLDGPLL